jgi:RNA polymerase sigma-70 factor, ECF subfamily
MLQLLKDPAVALPVSSADADPGAVRWVTRIRDGDAEAFRAFFRAFYPALCGFLRRYVDSDDVAEDLAQDVFVAVWERREELDPDRAIEGYLYTSARNRALNLLKRRGVVLRSHDLLSRTRLSPPTPEDLLRHTELAEAAQSAIDTLSPGARRIFLLRREAGLSYAEISELLGISVKTVDNQMGRALKALRSKLGPMVR